jgi:hypothetical protein
MRGARAFLVIWAAGCGGRAQVEGSLENKVAAGDVEVIPCPVPDDLERDLRAVWRLDVASRVQATCVPLRLAQPAWFISAVVDDEQEDRRGVVAAGAPSRTLVPFRPWQHILDRKASTFEAHDLDGDRLDELVELGGVLLAFETTEIVVHRVDRARLVTLGEMRFLVRELESDLTGQVWFTVCDGSFRIVKRAKTKQIVVDVPKVEPGYEHRGCATAGTHRLAVRGDRLIELPRP